MGDILNENYEEININASNSLKYMINALNSDFEFYECGFEYEYSPFEQSIKEYCDSYADFYIEHNANEIFFNSLVSVVEAVVNCNANYYDEDFFRPIELITYYLSKLIISSEDDLKNKIHDWLLDFIDEWEGDMIVEEYFKPFVNGERVYHADEYYTGYNDFNEVISIYKK